MKNPGVIIFSALIIYVLSTPVAAFHDPKKTKCGTTGKRECKVVEHLPSCLDNSKRVAYNGYCYKKGTCGKLNQRPCTSSEFRRGCRDSSHIVLSHKCQLNPVDLAKKAAKDFKNLTAGLKTKAATALADVNKGLEVTAKAGPAVTKGIKATRAAIKKVKPSRIAAEQKAGQSKSLKKTSDKLAANLNKCKCKPITRN